MHIAWDSLLVVALVSFAAAVIVVALVSFALVALSPRAGGRPPSAPAEPAASPSGRAVAGICLGTAALIVVYGLYVIVAS